MDLPRLNSDTALEAISGVQPELQNTRNDSEIFSKFSFDLLFLFQHSTLSWNRNVQQTKKTLFNFNRTKLDRRIPRQ